MPLPFKVSVPVPDSVPPDRVNAPPTVAAALKLVVPPDKVSAPLSVSPTLKLAVPPDTLTELAVIGPLGVKLAVPLLTL